MLVLYMFYVKMWYKSAFQWLSLQAYYFETLCLSLYQHCSINLTLAIKTRLSFNNIFLLRAVANIVLYSMRDRYDPFDILFGGVVWQRNAKISTNNNGKRSLEDSKFMSFWRAEVSGGKEKMTAKQNCCLFYFSPYPLSRSFSLSPVPPTTFAGFI